MLHTAVMQKQPSREPSMHYKCCEITRAVSFVVYEWMAFIVGCFFSYLIIRGSHLANFDWPSIYEVTCFFCQKQRLYLVIYQRVKSWNPETKVYHSMPWNTFILAHVRSIFMHLRFNFSFKIYLFRKLSIKNVRQAWDFQDSYM